MPRQMHLTASLILLLIVAPLFADQIDLDRHWDIATAYRLSTDVREKICLNGFRQFSALDEPGTEPAGAWGYLKVPGGTRMQFVVYDGNRQVDQTATDKMLESPHALYRRTFVLPEDAAGKRICLNVEFARRRATIYVNGREIKTIVPVDGFVDRVVEITDAVRTGENQIEILVASEPERPQRSDHQAGICDDVWLEMTPAGTRFDRVRVASDVGNRELLLTVRLAGADGQRLMLDGALFRDETDESTRGQKVMDLPPQALRIDGEGGATVAIDLREHWGQLELWNFENPALYDLAPDLTADGDRVDQIVERIGLRQTEIVGHKFYLNGKRCHTRDRCKFLEKFSRGRYAEFADERVFRQRLREYKKAGRNLCHSFDAYEPYLDNLLDVMDEEGLMFCPIIEGVSGYRAIRRDPEMFRKITEAIDHCYNHPCVIFWSMFTTGNFRSDEDIRNPWSWTLKYGPAFMNPRAREVMEGHEAFYARMDKCDPTRPTMFGTLTNFGDGIMGFYYPNSCTTTQDLASWPVKWYNSPDRKAHWGLEGAYRLPVCWGNEQLAEGEGIWEEQVYENAARSLGPEGYPDSGNADPSPNPRPFLHEPEPGDKVVGDVILHTGQNPTFMERTEHSVTKVIRSWRAYDVACAAPGDEFHLMYDVFRGMAEIPVHEEFRVPLEDLKTPGPIADRQTPYERLVNIQEPDLPRIAPRSQIFDGLQRNATGPFLPFLGHDGEQPGQFTWSDHAYTAGERVAKQVVLVDDHAEVRTVAFEVRVNGEVIETGQVILEPGEIRFIPFAFDAPSVEAKTELRLSLQAESAPGELAARAGNVAADIVKAYPSTREDELALQVFPSVATEIDPAALRIVLNDQAGQKSRLLGEAHPPFQPLQTGEDLDEANLLVVGRGSYTDEFRKRAAEWELSERLDMLIFAQHRGPVAFDRELHDAAARQRRDPGGRNGCNSLHFYVLWVSQRLMRDCPPGQERRRVSGAC